MLLLQGYCRLRFPCKSYGLIGGLPWYVRLLVLSLPFSYVLYLFCFFGSMCHSFGCWWYHYFCLTYLFFASVTSVHLCFFGSWQALELALMPQRYAHHIHFESLMLPLLLRCLFYNWCLVTKFILLMVFPFEIQHTSGSWRNRFYWLIALFVLKCVWINLNQFDRWILTRFLSISRTNLPAIVLLFYPLFCLCLYSSDDSWIAHRPTISLVFEYKTVAMKFLHYPLFFYTYQWFSCEALHLWKCDVLFLDSHYLCLHCCHYCHHHWFEYFLFKLIQFCFSYSFSKMY